ncbi:hypothetical protein PROVRETT_08276 [Providencia rettgeri DSM 1131]|nr:hypothetical protein PROVRETT_08276 [Providencia rettgeri DSM 1131]
MFSSDFLQLSPYYNSNYLEYSYYLNNSLFRLDSLKLNFIYTFS